MGIQKINKKGLQLSNAFMAVVVAGMIITAVGVTIGEWSLEYNSGLTYNLDKYDASNDFRDEAQFQQGKVTPQDAETGTGDFEGKTYRGVYSIISRVFLPFEAVFNMFEELETQFGLPSYLVEGILTLVFFALTFSIIAIIFRLSRTKA